MMKIKFNKRGLSVEEKVILLKSKGLIFNDEEDEKYKLSHIGYFRLSGYLKYFQDKNNIFLDGTTFKEIVDLYNFDRELRLLSLNAIEKIEISVKANLNDYISEKFGIFWYLDKSLFLLNTDKKKDIYNKLLLKIGNIQKKSNSIFVKHYFKKYDEKDLVSWMLFEELTIGELSNIFRLLKVNLKQKIADNYGIYQLDLQIWLHLLVNIRNISAHHGRLWNKEYSIKPRIKDRVLGKKYKTEINIDNIEVVSPNYYNTTIIIKYLLNIIDKDFLFVSNLEKLFINFPNIKKKVCDLMKSGKKKFKLKKHK